MVVSQKNIVRIVKSPTHPVDWDGWKIRLFSLVKHWINVTWDKKAEPRLLTTTDAAAFLCLCVCIPTT